MIHLALAIAHHLLVFSLVATIAIEATLLQPGMTPPVLARLGRLDAAYGAFAVLVILVGFARVSMGGKPSSFYFSNPYFWAKMGAFGVVGLLSIAPTVRILRWRKQANRDPRFVPSDTEVRAARGFVAAELGVAALIPVFAAVMARGIGL